MFSSKIYHKILYTRLLIKIIYKEIKSKKITTRLARQNNIKTLPELDLKHKVNSDTLFILGSGSSINELNNAQWEKIEQNNSIGFNFWLIHDFVPTFFCYEEPSNENERKNIFYTILDQKKENLSKTPIIAKDLLDRSISFSRIPRSLFPNFYLSYDFDIPIRGRDDVMNLSLEILARSRRICKASGLSFLYGYTASLSYLIFFALACGYDNIVLCGVDLNNSMYFYEENKDYYRSKGIIVPKSVQPQGCHSTNVRTKKKVPIDKVISSINEKMLVPNKTKLWVAKRSSALYPYLPCFF